MVDVAVSSAADANEKVADDELIGGRHNLRRVMHWAEADGRGCV
jgi:hypothetical protein